MSQSQTAPVPSDPSGRPSAAPRKRVLVTGSAGAVAQPLCSALIAAGHYVRGLDQRISTNLDDHVVADITDRPAVDRAMRGVQCLIHLAATPDDAPFIERLLAPNVAGLFHVMDAARQAGVERVILTSSCQTVTGLRRSPGEPPLTVHQAAPLNHYGLTKLWAEQMGEMYARCFNISVIAVRLGWLPRTSVDPAAVPDDSLLHDAYISPADIGRFFRAAVEAPAIDFAILYATGPGRPPDTGGPLYDLEPARRLLGYEPRDRWPAGFHLLNPSR